MRRLVLFSTILFFASFRFAPSQESLPIRTEATSDPIAVVRVMKEVHRKLKLPVLFETNHISLCDFTLQDDSYSNQAKRDHNYMLVLYLSSVAGTEVRLEQDLKAAGYPESVWRNAVDNLTKAQIDSGLKRIKQNKPLNDVLTRAGAAQQERDLLAALETFRRRSAKKLPQFQIDSDACGGDYIGFVKIRTLPKNGAVKLIREQFFQVCALRERDPYSTQCDLWFSAGPDQDFPVGTYRYLARWGEGPEECGKVDLSHPGSEADGRTIFKTIQETKAACIR
jgi:hypothetical protein